jgi:hypothetical protein
MLCAVYCPLPPKVRFVSYELQLREFPFLSEYRGWCGCTIGAFDVDEDKQSVSVKHGG